jgi:regulator of protease activity HflC (stomatin/prohibitin superfamily)
MSEDHPNHEHSSAPLEGGEDAGTRALSDALESSFAIVKVIMGGLLVLFLFSGLFKVGTQEKAIILRFGVPVGAGDGKLYDPGLHWAFPPPIDEVVRIPVGQVQSLTSTVGWYATTAATEAAGTEPPPEESLRPGRDGYLLTGDENIVHLRATLRYRIAEPGLRYMLEFAGASNLVQNAFDNALLYAAARYKVDDALTRDQAGFREVARSRFEQLVARHNLGITEIQVDNMQVIPPRQLKDAFARVSEAEVRRSKELNDAKSYENQTISKARADAEARKNAGETERTRLVEFVAAEVERFTNNLPAWRANRELFTQQRQAEILQTIYTNAQEKIVAPERANGGNRELRLQINREPPKPKVLQQPKGEGH